MLKNILIASIISLPTVLWGQNLKIEFIDNLDNTTSVKFSGVQTVLPHSTAPANGMYLTEVANDFSSLRLRTLEDSSSYTDYIIHGATLVSTAIPDFTATILYSEGDSSGLFFFHLGNELVLHTTNPSPNTVEWNAHILIEGTIQDLMLFDGYQSSLVIKDPLNDFSISITASQIPEPSTYASILSLSLLGLATYKTVRKRKATAKSI